MKERRRDVEIEEEKGRTKRREKGTRGTQIEERFNTLRSLSQHISQLMREVSGETLRASVGCY